MGKVEVTVQTKEGPVVAECIETSVPDLVIHLQKYPLGERMPDWGLWNVTHRPSGFAVVQGLPNQEIAMLAAAWLGQQNYDWAHADPSAIYEDERINHQIQELINAAGLVKDAIENLADLIDAKPIRPEDGDSAEWDIVARFPLRGRASG